MSPQSSQAETLLVFAEGGLTCALPAASVQEVVFLPALTRLPGMPSVLEGIMTLDGKAVPVMRAAKLLGVDCGPDSVYTPVLVLKGATAALAVERMEDILRPAAGELVTAGPDQSFNGCVVAEARHRDREIHVLAAEKLLLAEERMRIDEFKAVVQARLDEPGSPSE